MNCDVIPQQQGLYDPKNEHDACGIGFVVNIKGQRSNKIFRQSLTVLKNLDHRGGVGSERNTGDGAGVLIQIPHAFLKKECAKSGIHLPAAGDYGVGMIMLSQDAADRRGCEEILEKMVKESGQELLGWRDVPVDPVDLGETARASMPVFRQIFIGRKGVAPGMDFERKLFVIRKKAENSAVKNVSCGYFYISSMSSNTIVYKGMLTAHQIESFFEDLRDESIETALALVHSRYSTNTFPSWGRAHPNRYIIHNGEINTLRGNINLMSAREATLKADAFGDDMKEILPIINTNGSDSAMFDNSVEFMMLSGIPLEKVMMMMIPEPWDHHETMSDTKKAFYEFSNCLMEPWDGPAAIGFTDGSRVGAVLDRNGLRPSRYYVTTDDMVVLASEAGVLDYPPEMIVKKERLHPGRMLLIDTVEGRIINDEEIKEKVAAEHPYREWLDRYMLPIENLPEAKCEEKKTANLKKMQKAFGYTYEDLRMMLVPLARDGVDPIGAMGNDIPLAVLSEKPQLLYDYFKQLFAQVTNPPIDALRETIVTSSLTLLGADGDLIHPQPESCRQIKLKHPVLTNEELCRLQKLDAEGFQSKTLSILYPSGSGGSGMEQALLKLFEEAAAAVRGGVNILILSDRGVCESQAAVPALLAVSGLHHHLISEGLRTQTSIVLESGEPREVHHFATLIGFGVTAVNPYLAFESVCDLVNEGYITGKSEHDVLYNYVKAISKGVIKVLSKMGISTIRSYQGAQIFEAVGLHPDFIQKYFTSTPSNIGGIGIEQVAKEAQMRHDAAFGDRYEMDELEAGGQYQYRSDGEYHLYNPKTIHALQQACKTGDYELFKSYTKLINGENQNRCTLRGMMEMVPSAKPVPIDEVESVDDICRRFKTGAISFGSISKEAHEALAIAMNRIGGKSNTGEGGEDSARFIPEANGDSRCSAIKQVASGRFGVTSEYLVNAKEIQIKIAQGAKPGEGGQLPGRKVYPWVAKVRFSTPGVGLISPPPHHDIYSIEDLKELIFDLKNANPNARISVKLVSEAGVGTVAAGVAKGLADVVLISGYDGGTGASPRTSIRHAGMPWELGLAETHQTLLLNNLRSRIVVETDGKLMTGRDVAVAALLGAEEYGFATAPLVTLGCVMMRVCNLDTCPVGVATQNPSLRKKFCGDPQYVVNFMRFVAQELREYMAMLGFRSVNEMIGRSDMLKLSDDRHWKTKELDFSSILYRPEVPETTGHYCTMKQDHELERTLDRRVLLDLCAPAIEKGQKVDATVAIRNIDRAACTILGSEVSKKYGSAGLPEDTINLRFNGSAGQSFGAFVPRGITLTLMGDANDYTGKGFSGGKMVVRVPDNTTFVPEENIIIGNVAFYGATAGEAYIGGACGERFCVRNSGVKAVAEAVGDHGCEYMTGGCVVVLGSTGRNFAAGMSGGLAFVYDEDGSFPVRCNTEMVSLGKVEDKEEAAMLRGMVERHAANTGSTRAKTLLADWENALTKFVRVCPDDYNRMMLEIKKAHDLGLAGDEAMMAAFEANHRDLARVSGN